MKWENKDREFLRKLIYWSFFFPIFLYFIISLGVPWKKMTDNVFTQKIQHSLTKKETQYKGERIRWGSGGTQIAWCARCLLYGTIWEEGHCWENGRPSQKTLGRWLDWTVYHQHHLSLSYLARQLTLEKNVFICKIFLQVTFLAMSIKTFTPSRMYVDTATMLHLWCVAIQMWTWNVRFYYAAVEYYAHWTELRFPW